jgi:ketosteroid isomerase-like protein
MSLHAHCMTYKNFILAAYLIISGCCGQHSALRTDLDSMVATERAFAASSLKEGIRASFMKFFADSALAFSPEPYIYKQEAAKRPPPANPLARTLRWEPVRGDISASGELGYLMGPSILTDNSPQKKPVYYGFYLSIWKKQNDGVWKVIIDIGTTTTEEITKLFGKGFTPSAAVVSGMPAEEIDPAFARKELLELDRSHSELADLKDILSAYRQILDTNALFIRENIGPLAGKEAILDYIGKEQKAHSLEPMKADVSRAGDLGYTYGSFRNIPDSTKQPSGYYVRVWKKNSESQWRLVVDKEAPVEE